MLSPMPEDFSGSEEEGLLTSSTLVRALQGRGNAGRSRIPICWESWRSKAGCGWNWERQKPPPKARGLC